MTTTRENTMDALAVPASDLRWLLDSYLELLDGETLPDHQEKRLNTLRSLLMVHATGGAVHEAPPADEPVMYLLSRLEEADSVPLYVFHRKELAESALRLLTRGSGLRFEVLPVPLED